jgi:hypothetical protein
MSFSFVTAYPWWFLLLCPLAGLLAAGILYYKALRVELEQRRLYSLLAFLRFTAVTLLVFLLFGPLIRKQAREVEKPVIVIAQDNSESIVVGKDSSFYRDAYRKKIEELSDKLSDDYDVQTYSFGGKISEGLSWNFRDKETDFSDLFSELEARFSNRNLGAVIVASDGIYNRGTNPVFSSAGLKAPFFTIALGDTNPRKDIYISRIASNKIAYLGNTFPVQVIVDARMCQGKQSRLTVSKGNEILYTANIQITKPFFSQTFSLQLEAKAKGIQRYTVKVQPVEGELSEKNNVRDIFIDVLDSREKILVVGNALHPDLGALKLAIENAQTYTADVALLNDLKKPVKQYNLVIAHNIPSSDPASRVFIEQLKAAAMPVLYISGTATDFNQAAGLSTGNVLTDYRGKFNEATAVINSKFSLFQITDDIRMRIGKFPPITVPFGNFKSAAGVEVLAYQKIGMVETENPLITFTESNEIRTGHIVGEGLWKWRQTDFALNGDQKAFNELIGKTVQYLSSKVNKSLFRVNTRNSFTENEPLEFDAELYNESFEPVNQEEVTLTVINQDGKKFPFTFSKTSQAYHLNAGTFPPGEYKYQANVKGRNLSSAGQFIVTPLIAEQVNTIADHLMLNNLAASKGGAMYYPTTIDSLYKDLTARKDITSVSYTQTTMKELIDEKWLFFLVLLLLAAEWFLRKYNGLY